MNKKIIIGIGVGILAVIVALLVIGGNFNLSVGPQQQLQQTEEAAMESVNPTEISFQQYRNEERGIALQYPATWQVVEGQSSDATQVVMFVSPVKTGAELNLNVRVQVDESAENVTVPALGELFLQRHTQQYPDGTQVEGGAVTLADLPGGYLVYQATSEGVDAQWVTVWTEKEGVPYIVTYSATKELYDIYLPAVEQMLASFKILR